MKIVHVPIGYRNRLSTLLSVLLLLFVLGTNGAAQSTDLEYPTPVRTNEVSGTIAPRDLGDPRLTRYFYAFRGTPGDLIITAESENLEGDIDVFTAGVLRPLAKISMYAGGAKSAGSKTIYLRTRESLILRVEARTPNDTEGSFRVLFSGAFEPLGSEVPDPEPVIPTLSSATSAPQGRRVTATGARIEEPEPPPTAATTQPENNAPATPAPDSPASTGTPTTATTEAAKTEPVRPRTPRNRRPRTPRVTRPRPATTARKTPAPVEPAETPPAAEAAAGPRLIIETKDGMKVERYMTNVRRVTVDRGQIVVVTTDGKIDRQPMSNILRVAIEP
jgi:hypothetical protein